MIGIFDFRLPIFDCAEEDGGIFLAETGGGFFSGLLGLGALIVAVVWICFPFLVNSRLNELIREAKAARAEAAAAAKAMLEEQKKATEYLKYLSDRAYEKAAKKPDVQKLVPPEREVYRVD